MFFRKQKPIFLIVGLGNYGSRYEGTIHNLGFEAVRRAADKVETAINRKECKALTATIMRENKKLLLALPQTYMNLSGDCVALLIKKYKIDTANIIIVYDDIDLEKGTTRYRDSGSGGTHNGMRHIVCTLGTEKIARLRIGAGRPKLPIDLKDYVLAKIPVEDAPVFEKAIESAAELLLGKADDFFHS